MTLAVDRGNRERGHIGGEIANLWALPFGSFRKGQELQKQHSKRCKEEEGMRWVTVPWLPVHAPIVSVRHVRACVYIKRTILHYQVRHGWAA